MRWQFICVLAQTEHFIYIRSGPRILEAAEAPNMNTTSSAVQTVQWNPKLFCLIKDNFIELCVIWLSPLACQLWHLSNCIIASTNGGECVVVKQKRNCWKFLKLSRKCSEIIKNMLISIKLKWKYQKQTIEEAARAAYFVGKAEIRSRHFSTFLVWEGGVCGFRATKLLVNLLIIIERCRLRRNS